MNVSDVRNPFKIQSQPFTRGKFIHHRGTHKQPEDQDYFFFFLRFSRKVLRTSSVGPALEPALEVKRIQRS